MKKLPVLLALLLFGYVAGAQPKHTFRDGALVRYIDSLPVSQPFDTAHPWQKWETPLLYIISDRDIYQLFGYGAFKQLRDLDFSRYHILGEQRCKQCMANCRHEDGQTACHRNRCNLVWVWSLRDNSKAFDSVQVSVTDLPEAEERERPDGVVNTVPGFTYWYVSGFGDCHARFEYSLAADRYYPSLVLTEKNIYGGCRAAGRKDYLVRFKEQAGKTQFYKQTVLAE